VSPALLKSPLTVIVFAPHGRDAALAERLLTDANIEAASVQDLAGLVDHFKEGAGVILATEEGLATGDLSDLHDAINDQPPWADIPIILLTHRGGGVERNPAARRLSETLGNVSFLERPFHPTTLVSLLKVALRSRRRQYEARGRLEAIREGEEALRLANASLEQRVEERTQQLQKTEAALRQAQKLEAVGQLTGGIAHDFNNLLMVISGGLDVLDRQTDLAKRDRILEGMRQASARGANLTKQLLSFSRHQTLHPEAVDLSRNLGGMQALLDHALRGDVVIETDLAPDLWPLEVDPTELELAILNLCVNARDAMPKGGTIRITASNAPTASGDRILLMISDTGTGMSREIQSRVFEPFFTTKDVGKGSGLGLAQVYGFATQSGGDIRIASQEGRGTTFTLELPRSRAAPGPVLPVLNADAPETRSPERMILLVEDDDNVAALVSEMLVQAGYGFTRVSGPAAALGALSDSRRIDAVLSDIMMPGGMNGLELAQQIRDRRPGLPILLTSGYARAFEDEAAQANLEVLPKPYRSQDLRAALERLLT